MTRTPTWSVTARNGSEVESAARTPRAFPANDSTVLVLPVTLR